MVRPANYVRPIQLSLQVLRYTGINSFPVSLKQILKHYGIRLMTYEDYCRVNECEMQLCYSLFGRDGATIEENGKYLIVYNKTPKPKNRIRFTLAHELGHIFHRHHKELDVGILQRLYVEKSLYDVMEDEANCFARNLLCPAVSVQTVLRDHGFVFCEYDQRHKRYVWMKIPSTPCLPDLPANLTDSFLVRQSFLVTESAAGTRCHFLKEDLRNTSMSMASAILDRITFTAQWRCRKCGAMKLTGTDYCYHCGSKNSFSLTTKPSPSRQPVFIRYTGHRFSSCPVCGNNEMPHSSQYCPICGNVVSNPCIPRRVRNRNISHLLDLVRNGSVHLNPPGARYCLTCGAPTFYGESTTDGLSTTYITTNANESGTKNRASLYYYLLSRGFEPKTDNQGGLPSVKYGPAIPVINNNDEYKVQKCPMCLNEDIEPDADYCIMCGTSLTNICDGIEGSFDDLKIRHSNPANARFCHLCGKPTAYSRLSILPPYQEVLRRTTNAEGIRRELAEINIDEDLFWKMHDKMNTEENLGTDTSSVPCQIDNGDPLS